MAYQTVAIPMTLRDLQGHAMHLTQACLKCNFSSSCSAADKISTHI